MNFMDLVLHVSGKKNLLKLMFCKYWGNGIQDLTFVLFLAGVITKGVFGANHLYRRAVGLHCPVCHSCWTSAIGTVYLTRTAVCKLCCEHLFFCVGTFLIKSKVENTQKVFFIFMRAAWAWVHSQAVMLSLGIQHKQFMSPLKPKNRPKEDSEICC